MEKIYIPLLHKDSNILISCALSPLCNITTLKSFAYSKTQSIFNKSFSIKMISLLFLNFNLRGFLEVFIIAKSAIPENVSPEM